MFLTDPAPTQADLHFRIFGFPVRVHPLFWLIALLIGARSAGNDPKLALMWVGVVFISILVHELGHAVAIRLNGGHARIVLYSFGGLAIEENARRTPTQQIAISFAGPLAGFFLAAFVLAFVQASGHKISFTTPENVKDWAPVGLLFTKIYIQPFQSLYIYYFVAQMLFINILWGLINLVPIYPLDGGQISRELFTLGNVRDGIVKSLQLSIVAAAGIAILIIMKHGLGLNAFLFGYLAYSSWQTLQHYTGRYGGGQRW